MLESMPVTSCASSGDHEAGGQKYVSLQNNNSQSHPELTGNNKIILMRRITSGLWKWLSEASCWTNPFLPL